MNVGRTGVITPGAIIEPVNLGGVTVRNASLHNADYIAERDIRIGDYVTVKRAGDVIPYIIGPIVNRRDGSERPWAMPERCPACGTSLERTGRGGLSLPKLRYLPGPAGAPGRALRLARGHGYRRHWREAGPAAGRAQPDR